jgi:hypothetical protein
MSEEQIERLVEKRMDALDRSLMKGTMHQAEYDVEVKRLDRWAQQQYDKPASLRSAH